MGETKNDFRRRCREVYLAYRINCMPGGKTYTPSPPKAEQNFWHPVDTMEEETPIPADPYSSPSSDSPKSRREASTKEGKAPSENLAVPRNHMVKEESTPEVDGRTSPIFKDI
ncbi:54S ribosomal protein L7 [Lasiodiplodia theobromae]|uniref:54S ribosomal protein L7 n=1 Tax=Lasiodiplodia theobromae TaxID=45133 RepID=UPI0015C34159|nr:54S ribosomal protein L7 [Lasiodiplodia theobromae]KAF4541903.1 54S ribosomal protein L7 [Lasiodiplodia theobromae]